MTGRRSPRDSQPKMELCTKAAPVQTRRRLINLTLRAAEANLVSPVAMLRSGRAGYEFAKAVASSGSPRFRERALRLLREILINVDPPIQLVSPALELAERCHMQGRSHLALRIVQSILDGETDLGDLATAEADATSIRSVDQDHFGEILPLTLELGVRLANRSETITKAAAVWRAHCHFARRSRRHELGGYAKAIDTALRLETAAPRLAPVVFLTAMRGLVVSRPPTPELLAPVLNWFVSRRRTEHAARAYLLLVAGLARSQDEQLAKRSARFLRRLAIGPRDEVIESGKHLNHRVREWAGLQDPFHTPMPLPFLHEGNSSDSLMIDYFSVVRYAHRPGVGPVPANVVLTLLKGRSATVSSLAFNELFRRQERPPLKPMKILMRYMGENEDHPEAVARSIAFQARYGNLAEARRLTRVMLGLQQKENRGANLFTAHRALGAMGEREEGAAGEMYAVAASLLFLSHDDR